jgi:3-hydroxyacyl-CoA dehydrogenase
VTTFSVGIVGAGVMGTSLSHALTLRGIDIVMQDSDPAALEQVLRRLHKDARLTRLMNSSGGLSSESLGRLHCTEKLADLAHCELVIENVTEDVAIKRQVHRELDGVLDEMSVVAVNTSAVPISELALATDHPDRVVGAHFMNPVSSSSTVEVIRTPYVAAWALERLDQLIVRLAKDSVVVSDAAGFVINRCLMIFINEAAALLDDGVATPQQVDRLFKGCLGHRTGPLRTADIIGIDTIVQTLDVLSDHYGPERFTPSARLRRMLDGGHHGRKSGRGFYDYTNDGERT